MISYRRATAVELSDAMMVYAVGPTIPAHLRQHMNLIMAQEILAAVDSVGYLHLCINCSGSGTTEMLYCGRLRVIWETPAELVSGQWTDEQIVRLFLTYSGQKDYVLSPADKRFLQEARNLDFTATDLETLFAEQFRRARVLKEPIRRLASFTRIVRQIRGMKETAP